MAREPKPIFCLIKGVPVYEGEQLLIMLCILGLKMEEMKPILGLSLDQIKACKKALFERFNVGNAAQLNCIMQRHGFDAFGCYKGVPVFNKRERNMLLRHYPWLGELPAYDD